MKTIGLIGGMSWESTLEYYRIINELVKEKLGGWHSAKILLYSVDFDRIVRLQHKGEWRRMGEILADIATRLENCGADVILICTNTMHKVADYVEERISVPLLNIIDATAERLKEKDLSKVGLLGTKFTMEDGFYQERLAKYGIEVIVPDETDRQTVHSIIFDELCLGVFKESSKIRLVEIIRKLKEAGAEGIILGCTELPLIVKQEDVDVLIFDTTRIHAEAAVDFALK